MEAYQASPQAPAPRASGARRLATETKNAFKTTEFWVYLAFLLALLIAGTVDNSEGSQFGADDVWLFGTVLTAAYLISRGLAKSGSRDPYWDREGGEDGSITDRLKAAAEVLTEPEQRHEAPTQSQGPVR